MESPEVRAQTGRNGGEGAAWGLGAPGPSPWEVFEKRMSPLRLDCPRRGTVLWARGWGGESGKQGRGPGALPPRWVTTVRASGEQCGVTDFGGSASSSGRCESDLTPQRVWVTPFSRLRGGQPAGWCKEDRIPAPNPSTWLDKLIQCTPPAFFGHLSQSRGTTEVPSLGASQAQERRHRSEAAHSPVTSPDPVAKLVRAVRVAALRLQGGCPGAADSGA